MRLYLVCHAAPTVRPGRPAGAWHLSPGGREAAEALSDAPCWSDVRRLHTSPEPKAAGTAQRIGGRHGLAMRIEPGLREVENRAWVEDGYRDLVRRYLTGEAVDGWEARPAALGRIRACIDAIVAEGAEQAVAAVSHGLVLALYLTDLLGLDGNASHEQWSGMRVPDIAMVVPEARRLEREFGRYEALT